MLRRTLPSLPLALLAVAAPASAGAQPLERGDHGAPVARLQRALHVHPADGIFGPGTVRAVKRFQRRHHLDTDGIAGAGTERVLRRARRARARTVAATGVRVTGRGPSVRVLQRRLGIDADGVFGPGTARAVRAFQRSHGMEADGIVGPATWSALGLRAGRPVLKRTALHRRGRAALSGPPPAIARAVAAADRIATTPYIFGGGHRSVSYVLHHAGVLASPLASGELASWGAPGPGRWITVYANAGHAFMVIDGRRYDTSARSTQGSRWASSLRPTEGYVARHPAGL